MLRSSLASLFVAPLAAGPLAALAALPVQEMEMPQPAEQHAQLLEAVGAWEGTITAFFPGMPSEPMEAKETVEAIGGFWTQSRFECDFMGMP